MPTACLCPRDSTHGHSSHGHPTLHIFLAVFPGHWVSFRTGRFGARGSGRRRGGQPCLWNLASEPYQPGGGGGMYQCAQLTPCAPRNCPHCSPSSWQEPGTHWRVSKGQPPILVGAGAVQLRPLPRHFRHQPMEPQRQVGAHLGWHSPRLLV